MSRRFFLLSGCYGALLLAFTAGFLHMPTIAGGMFAAAALLLLAEVCA
jgi:hypothetical protein